MLPELLIATVSTDLPADSMRELVREVCPIFNISPLLTIASAEPNPRPAFEAPAAITAHPASTDAVAA